MRTPEPEKHPNQQEVFHLLERYSLDQGLQATIVHCD